MARAMGPRKVHRYTAEFKLKAVKLSELNGVQVQDVAEARVLQICFVSATSKLFGVTYRLCPVCGVSMDERSWRAPNTWHCAVCGFTTSDALY